MMQRDARRFLYPLVVVFAIGYSALTPHKPLTLKRGPCPEGGDWLPREHSGRDRFCLQLER